MQLLQSILSWVILIVKLTRKGEKYHIEADYTNECPLCGCEKVTELHVVLDYSDADIYVCDHCTSEWEALDGGNDYHLVCDNTDGIDPSTIASRC